MMGMHLWQQEPQAVFTGGLLLTNRDSVDPVADYQDPTYPALCISKEQLSNIEPNLNHDFEVSSRYFFAQEGLVDQIKYTENLWGKAEKLGASFEFGNSVAEVITEDESQVTGVVLTSGKRVPCDTLVLASGTETEALASQVGVKVPLLRRPGLLAHTHPLPPLIHRIIIGDDVYFLQRPDGTIVIGDDTAGATDVGKFSQEERIKYGKILLKKAADILPALRSAKLKSAEVGFRPYPADGLPICGPVSKIKGLYIAVTHSGVTLAPVLSQYISQEILQDTVVQLLTPYRLEGRNFEEKTHTYDIQYCGWQSEAECPVDTSYQ
eukprot:CAMPEP_0117742334 /NCGR_PEP_ID=MMETSP0947-20121206/5486_1 /TAXON_ID=44440 /ORGANISM="Chattonella subsalsa, Strain CCMP2191" /LENGTH=322 /DNA_ID=CAMNT_0005558841 /DNA_START=249 /DNA_END=1217 /DNA_ORIENTATION=+